MPSYLERLERAAAVNRSLVCVGLDPEPERLPVTDAAEFNRVIIDATRDLVCAYKPNLSFYEAMGLPGLQTLASTIDYIRQVAPEALLIGDAKRGDMGPSAAAYARAMFQVWDFDTVTVNPWGGGDTVQPFLEDANRGVFLWCRGSNPGAGDMQDLTVESPYGKSPVYEHLAQMAAEWNGRGNLGLVVGATAPEQLAAVRRLCPELPLLIPGVGAQGGDLAAAVRNGVNSGGRRAVINASRSIIYAGDGADYAAAARRAAVELRDVINGILAAEGKGWP